MEQTPTALVVDGQKDNFGTAPMQQVIDLYPRLLRQRPPTSEAIPPSPEAHDSSDVETGERRDCTR